MEAYGCGHVAIDLQLLVSLRVLGTVTTQTLDYPNFDHIWTLDYPVFNKLPCGNN
jgi:hypothetical protein